MVIYVAAFTPLHSRCYTYAAGFTLQHSFAALMLRHAAALMQQSLSQRQNYAASFTPQHAATFMLQHARSLIHAALTPP